MAGQGFDPIEYASPILKGMFREMRAKGITGEVKAFDEEVDEDFILIRT
jgi:hypothetical protein